MDKDILHLDALYQELSSRPLPRDTSYILNDILQIKILNPQLKDYGALQYNETKDFISSYINFVKGSKNGAGYDAIDISKMQCVITDTFNYLEQTQLLKYACQELNVNVFLDESREMEKMMQWITIKNLLRSGSLLGWIRGMVRLSSYNVWTCLLTVIIVGLIHCLLLLPCSDSEHAVFLIDYHPYSSDFALNHLLNFLIYEAGIGDVVFCTPLGVLGIVVIFAFKIFYIIYVSNILVDLVKTFLQND